MTAIVLFLMLLQYGTWILYGVVEEKSSRVVEVLLAAVRPTQLLTGKVLGIGAVALGQGLLLTGTALVTGMAVGLDRLPEGTPATIAIALLWVRDRLRPVQLRLRHGGLAGIAPGGCPERLVPAQRGHDLRLRRRRQRGVEPGYPAVARAVVLPAHGPVRHAGAGGGWRGHLGSSPGRRHLGGRHRLVARLAGSVYSRVILRGGSRLTLRQAWRAQPS
ncbi:MAG: ABC transporter permease [Actinobacteria bacterium]|nr:ABC transporter permease [Actinomycetota bacterium]